MESVKVATGPFLTHLHRAGEGEAVLFIHGSGPGATGLSNWQLALPEPAVCGVGGALEHLLENPFDDRQTVSGIWHPDLDRWAR